MDVSPLTTTLFILIMGDMISALRPDLTVARNKRRLTSRGLGPRLVRDIAHSTPKCPLFEYWDEETSSCEDCGVICGAYGPPSPQCEKEPSCKQVDGHWNCTELGVCDATCVSPPMKLTSGKIVRQGKANCTCKVETAHGDRPCKGLKQIDCLVDKEAECDHQRPTIYIIMLIAFIVALSSALFVFIGWKYRQPAYKWLAQQRIRCFPRTPVPVTDPDDAFARIPVPFTNPDDALTRTPVQVTDLDDGVSAV